MEWYKKSSEDSLAELGSSTAGLSVVEATNRLEKYGRNELKKEQKKPFILKLKDQFLDPMILILIAAAVISFAMGEKADPVIIMAIVIVNAALSIYQEGKAEEAIAALEKMSSPLAKVIRDGKDMEIDSGDIVPGDYVILETGDIVPADLRLVESLNLKIDESSLTGESVPVEKNSDEVYSEDLGIGDRENIAYSSTIVSYGRGTGVVISTGEHTEIGKIAKNISAIEDEPTPLQKKLAGLSKTLGILVIIICAIVLVVGIIYKHEFMEMLLISVSLAVAAIPEGLPAIVTIVLSIGMKKMAERKAVVKKLLAVETLGTTTVICSDKTGTLTQNEMTVTKIFTGDRELTVTGTGYNPKGEILENSNKVEEFMELNVLSHIATLVNDAKLEISDESKIIGDPTEGALLTLSEKIGHSITDTKSKFKRVNEIPFDSSRKMMSTFHEDIFGTKVASLTKGAPDIILSRCSRILIDGEVKDLTDDLRSEILSKNSEFAREALRVLAYAYRDYESMPSDLDYENIENNMIFVGLTGMIDPARPEAKEAIKECRSAGIIPIMITGDYLETALAIAKELGIATDDSEAITGRELDELSPEELREVVKTKRVFSRVSPETKVQIVTALQENGHLAAMTGDGVNDAPAIKKADIGIAMGITGTDVAKSTAEVILMDDNFATIVNAVEEGRVIYSNIKKFVGYLLSCNIGEVLIVLIAILIDIPVPFEAIQLLWLNLVTDSFPALALGVEPGDEGIMNEKPRDPNEPILDKKLSITVIIQSIAITIATLVVYIYSLKTYGDTGDGLVLSRTMAFATLVTAELLRSYSARSLNWTLFHIGPFSNMTLVKGTAFSFLLTLLVLYVPQLETLFDLAKLGIGHWIIVLIASSIPLVIGEVQKVVRFGTDG